MVYGQVIGGVSSSMAAASGRKRKTPQDWATEYTDFYVKKMKSDGVEREALVCTYCSLEINIAGKVWDRIHEHICSKRHAKLKENYLKVLSAEFYFHKPITVHLELYLFYSFIHFLLYIGQY